MEGKALTAMRKALVALRCVIFAIHIVGYVFVWLIWGVGGLRLLEDIGATAIPFLAFVLASAMVMLIGFIGFQRDLLAFLRLRPSPSSPSARALRRRRRPR